ncbi:MATH and LRR domain-containing protein PFE0570w [Belonocnema kinseyi]|uniref:MATH and LRR domain-containing protein PFE0570w n=1 Tax=Belonocnema kinseyi TaxID=2817044 RepID=UPI00143D3909|nr:MATH and LRR domain-containing protein PFE0570w [Belonocnema kinseyi]
MTAPVASIEKLEDCEVCAKNKAKYTCPKCEVRTCSLTCSNIHKKELECDGIRDKTKFLAIQSMTDSDLMSDYCLLQEVGRSVDKYNRDPLKRCATINNFLPKWLRNLKSAAFRRGINLEFMPRSFSRNRQNSTRYIWKTNELLWRIEWIFPDAENIKWTTQRASENARLSVLLENLVNPEMKSGEDPEVLSLKRLLRSKLQFYRSAGLNGIKVLLKSEKVYKSNSRFFELDTTLTLQENFEQRTIIEFPTLYVILSHNSDMYEIIDSDDEDKKQVNIQQNPPQRQRFRGNRNRRNYPVNGNFNQNEIITLHQKQDKEVETTPVNLLFHTEFSDSEDEKAKAEKDKQVKNMKMQRKRKPRRSPNEIIQKKIQKVRASVNEFTGICKSDSEDDILAKKKITEAVVPSQINSTELVKKNGDLTNGKSEIQKPLSNFFFDSHITDSEGEGPCEEPIQRLNENEKSIEKESDKTENNNEKNNKSDMSKEKENKESNTAIQNIAMNYFSAYMSDTEEEIESDVPSKSGNFELQLPDK